MRLWKFSLVIFIILVFLSQDAESKARKPKKKTRKKKARSKVKDAAKSDKTNTISKLGTKLKGISNKPQIKMERHMCGTEPCCECTSSYGRFIHGLYSLVVF